MVFPLPFRFCDTTILILHSLYISTRKVSFLSSISLFPYFLDWSSLPRISSCPIPHCDSRHFRTAERSPSSTCLRLQPNAYGKWKTTNPSHLVPPIVNEQDSPEETNSVAQASAIPIESQINRNHEIVLSPHRRPGLRRLRCAKFPHHRPQEDRRTCGRRRGIVQLLQPHRVQGPGRQGHRPPAGLRRLNSSDARR